MTEFFQLLNNPVSLAGLPTTLLEILGFLTGAICVWLNTRQNVWGWCFGIINAILYAAVFWQAKLYADVTLQGYFFITSIYGIYMWLYGGNNHHPLNVSLTPAGFYKWFILIFIFTTFLWGYILNNYTDASMSYLDSGLTVASLLGQWMLARKYLENWLLWIVADFCYMGMFAYKGLYLTSILYFVFLILATMGYLSWRKDYRKTLRAD